MNVIEHYHNSSWLEYGGAPEKATKTAFVYAIDKYLKRQQQISRRTRAKITWQDVEDCLVLVTNNFSTQTSYENQTKKAITNKFVQEAMTEFFRSPPGGLLHREPRRGAQDRRAGAHQQTKPRERRKSSG